MKITACKYSDSHVNIIIITLRLHAANVTVPRLHTKQLNTSKYNNSAAAKYLRKRCFCCAILCRRIFFTLKGGSLKITAYKYSDSHVNIIIITLRLHAANVTVPRLHTESVRIPKSARRTVQRLSHRKVQRLSHRKCDDFQSPCAIILPISKAFAP